MNGNGLGPTELAALNTFLAFRRDTGGLGARIASIEAAIEGLDGAAAAQRAEDLDISDDLLRGAVTVKALAAQIDVVLHAAGILRALPHILERGETVLSVSLGAGNTGRGHDLETTHQIAEAKFIGWRGGAEAVRQDGLLADLFSLASETTEKRRVMYLTGTAIPLKWLQTSRRDTRRALGRKQDLPGRFDEIYGTDAYRHVCDYWTAIKDIVEIVDLSPIVPALAGVDVEPPE